MQKIIKLSDTHYIGVDDSEIKVGDIVAEKLLTGGYELFTIHTPNDIDKLRQKKVTHSSKPLEDINFVDEAEGKIIPKIKPLSLSEIRELLGMVDVESRALKPAIKYIEIYTDANTFDFRKGYEKGYYEALEDNKEKKYTEEDMRKTIEMARESHDYLYGYSWSKEQIIQGLQSKTEWECIIDEQGKLKLI